MRLALALGPLGVFWIAALARTGGAAFAPLDDVYIYFDFARATARGHVLAWSDDTGFSTGATSPIYALLLAPFWALGARGDGLHVGAAAIAIASLRAIVGDVCALAGRRRAAQVLGVALTVTIPLAAWSFASGMEAAFVAACIARAVRRVADAAETPPAARDRAQRHAGLAIGLLALARPECVPLAVLLGIALAHASGSRPLARALAYGLGPAAVGLAALLTAARLTTGEWVMAGALRKVVLYDPHATPEDVLVLALTQLVRLWVEGFELGLGSPWAARALLALALGGALARRTRRLGLPLLLGAAAALALVSLNRTAPYQNLRYVVPTLVMLAIGATLGLSAATRRRPLLHWAAPALALGLLLSAYRNWPWQVRHFANAAKNIHEQQAEVGRRLARLDPPPRRVFVGDAGAIPYFADRPALDGLGLGGYHDLPFARASVEGVGAVVELIERMPPAERPDVLAIYDSWWPGLGSTFGAPLFSVRIEDNVICADPEKKVYRADWSALEDRDAELGDALDRVDLGDLVDERAHGLVLGDARTGAVSLALHPRGGRPVADAVRALAEGQWLRVRLGAPGQELRAIRLVGDTPGARLAVESGGGVREARFAPRASGEDWLELTVPLAPAAGAGDVVIRATDGELRLGAIVAE